NVLLNYLMIPHYKAEGAALATLITQSLTALVQLIIAYKIFRIEINWNIYGGLFLLAVTVFTTHYFTKEMDFTKSISITCLSAVIIILITGLFRFSDIRQMIRFKNQD
ncbi:MAG: polysaccharide biosynthesis C-terminal domain-containing protein, partial [Crocinitomicaceae bacterium]|nr:polysaccharide biosynthesis C-terminal domain-containing protein [Crocinitomicaceae bacterium]